MILGTVNGASIVALPSDTDPLCAAPSSIEWDPQEAVACTSNPFTGAEQLFDWGASWWQGQLSFRSMTRYSADVWQAFILELRGGINVFSIGDPLRVAPKGVPLGAPLVSGAGQVGYSLVTRGWQPNSVGLLLPGDYFSVPIGPGPGTRLYRALEAVSSDASGSATISFWPPLRDQPGDGVAIATSNCTGLFRLAANKGNKFSVNATTLDGFTGLAIREAI